jgi:hypothetical protein
MATDMRFKGGNVCSRMNRAGGVSILAVWLTTSLSSAATPAPMLLSGPYQVGELGVFTLTVTRNDVKGRSTSGSRCPPTPSDSPSELSLEGTLEGSVLVGKLTTCLEGSGCRATGAIPFLGVVSDTSITAYLTIPGGCSAPGLDSRLTIQVDYSWLKKNGEDAMLAGKWQIALTHLRRAVQMPEGAEDPKMLNLLGAAHNGSKAFADGRQMFEAALALANRKSVSDDLKAQILYNLACSEAGVANRDPVLLGRAIEHLKQALSLSQSNQVREALAVDKDLDPLRALPEFQKLVGTRKGAR